MNKNHTVIIVDDHRLFRNGLNFIISELDGFEVVAEASNGKEFLMILDNYQPDIVLMDINMPGMNGIDATRNALKKFPDLKVLVLSMFGEDDYYQTMVDIGVKGFLLKDSEKDELEMALRRILEGENFFSQELLLQLIKNKKSAPVIKLSDREKEVLELICKGQSNQEIADVLNISQRTVERHRANLLFKTESNNSISLVIFAIKNNLVKI